LGHNPVTRMSLTAGARLGSYEVVALLREGVMGAVYRARDTKLDCDVALKVLHSAFRVAVLEPSL